MSKLTALGLIYDKPIGQYDEDNELKMCLIEYTSLITQPKMKSKKRKGILNPKAIKYK